MSILNTPDGPVWYSEMPGSPEYSYQGNAARMRRRFQCYWPSRWAFCLGTMGYSLVGFYSDIPGGGTSHVYPSILRTLPTPYYDLRRKIDQGHILWPTGIESISGMGPKFDATNVNVPRDDDTELYQYAVINVVYEAPTFVYRTDNNSLGSMLDVGSEHASQYMPVDCSRTGVMRYVTKIIQPQAEHIRFPHGFMKWSEDVVIPNPAGGGNTIVAPKGQVVNQTIGRMVNHNEITYIWHQVPALDRTAGNIDIDFRSELIGAALTHIGCVNSAQFDNYGPGTLLLTSVEARPYKWINGVRYYDYVYRMKHMDFIENAEQPRVIRPAGSHIGHNYLPRQCANQSGGTPIEPTFCLPTHDGTEAVAPLGNGKGRTLFAFRNFDELFLPISYADLFNKYKP